MNYGGPKVDCSHLSENLLVYHIYPYDNGEAPIKICLSETPQLIRNQFNCFSEGRCPFGNDAARNVFDMAGPLPTHEMWLV